MPNRTARPVTVSALKKAAPARTVSTPAKSSAPATARKRAKKSAKKAPDARLPHRAKSKVIVDGSPRLVGYARTSTDNQTTAVQSAALTRAAVDVLFKETASGANKARPVLAKTLALLQPGDTLVVWRLDRLGRSLGHLIEIVTGLRERGIFLRSLIEGFDTSTASGRLLHHVLGAVANFESEVIKERTVAGMQAAKKRGTHVGRPHALTPSRLIHARRLLEEGKSQVEVARILGVSRATIQRA